LLAIGYTWVRTNELRMMRWDEIHGDMWVIPEGKMKRARDHVVPLSRQALAILEQMRLRSYDSQYVFPSYHRGDRPISNNTILALIARIGYKGKMTGHGWRSVASTWANEKQYSPDAIEMQLSHSHESKDKTRAAYNRAKYMDIRRPMLQDWADWLDGFKQD
jgi:integrase